MPITGLVPGMAYHYAGCCHPLPGDDIVGIVTTGKGVTIHGRDCPTLDELRRDAGTVHRRRLELRTVGKAAATARPATPRAISVIAANEPASLADL